jgi:hypothetical protein
VRKRARAPRGFHISLREFVTAKVVGHAPAVWIEEGGDVSRIQTEEPDIALHIPLVEARLTVKVLTIEKVLQNVGECEAAAVRGRGKEVERGANACFGQILGHRLPDEE